MKLETEFWYATPIAPVPLLRQLNDWVIEQNEKRLPKWKFRFASDLAVQIQPRITRAHAFLFECVALRTENISIKHFIEPNRLRGSVYWRLRFDLFGDDCGQWELKPRSAGWGRDCPVDEVIELRQQVIDALHPDRFAHLSPERMLSPHCLICGKGLTDPVSMARWIGPECWGSASNNLPRLFRAEAALREAVL